MKWDTKIKPLKSPRDASPKRPGPFIVLCSSGVVSPIAYNISNTDRTCVEEDQMSVGVHMGSKSQETVVSNWTKMKRAPVSPRRREKLERPLTATLERPKILDISLLGKIDMSTLTRKSLLSIQNLCIVPLEKLDPRDAKRNGTSMKDGRGGKTRKFSNLIKNAKKSSKDVSRASDREEWDDDSSASEPSKLMKVVKTKSVSKPAPAKRSPGRKETNNNEGEDGDSSSRSCHRPVILRKGRNVDEVFGVPPKTAVPEPCKTCGRPEQPERFHSHPPATSRPPTTVDKPPPTKSSVRKPVAINYRSSGRNKAPETAKAPKSPARQTTPAAAEKPPRTTVEKTTPTSVEKPRGRRTVTCYLCGREFGTASYPLHEPHCLQRWQRENSQLPPHLQRPLPEKPEKPFTSDDWNQQAWEAAQSTLVPCMHCGRTFYPDRLDVHQRSCKGTKKESQPPPPQTKGSMSEERTSSPGGGRGPPAVACYICGRPFGTRSIAIHEPQCLEKWKAENERLPSAQRRPEPTRPGQSPPTPPPAPAPPPHARRPRFLLCYLCGREFTAASLPIHEAQCLKKWRAENDRLPPELRRPEPLKPHIPINKETGQLDLDAAAEAMWRSHLDQLVPCVNCGRTFNPDRLEVHQRACKGPRR